MTARFGEWIQGEAFDRWAAGHGLTVAPITAQPEMAWCDVETTGLDAHSDALLEIGFILTDRFGRVIPDCVRSWLMWEPYYHRCVEKMDEFVQNMHTASGLLDDLTEAMRFKDVFDLSVRSVEEQAIQWLDASFNGQPNPKVPFAGNSVRLDREFLKFYMPVADDWFHYRIQDISSIREFAKLLNPAMVKALPEPIKGHRVIGDLVESITLYRHMAKDFFVLSDHPATVVEALGA